MASAQLPSKYRYGLIWGIVAAFRIAQEAGRPRWPVQRVVERTRTISTAGSGTPTREADDLLERGAVGEPHRVRDQAGHESDARRRCPPGRRVGALGGGQLGGRLLQGRPERGAARL